MASQIDPTLGGDLTEDGRDVTKSNLQTALQTAKDELDGKPDIPVTLSQIDGAASGNILKFTGVASAPVAGKLVNEEVGDGEISEIKLAASVRMSLAELLAASEVGTFLNAVIAKELLSRYIRSDWTAKTSIGAAADLGWGKVDNNLILDNTFGASEDGQPIQRYLALQNVGTSDITLTLSDGEGTPAAAVLWTTGESVTTGDLRCNLASDSVYRLYSADSTGTTGATPPTHTTGSVSDGTINWTMVRAIGLINADAFFVTVPANGGEVSVDSISNSGTAPFVEVRGDGPIVDLGDRPLVRAELRDYSETSPADTGFGGAETVNFVNGQVVAVTLTSNVSSLTISNPPASGNAGTMTFIIDHGTGPFTWAHPTGIKWGGNGTAPTLSSGASDVDIITYVTRDAGTTWYGFVGGIDFA